MILLDASALLKLVFEEKESEIARSIFKKEMGSKERIMTLSIALPEGLNALWKYCALKGELSEIEYGQTVEDLLKLFELLVEVRTENIAKHAAQIALKYRLPVYDSLYLAGSSLTGAPLLTFDRKMAEAAGEAGVRLADRQASAF